jgi:hypothetical protein
MHEREKEDDPGKAGRGRNIHRRRDQEAKG